MRVNDNVVLVEPLAEGGMGSVWVARHETLKTEVAVKFIGGTLSTDDPEVLARFNREASTAAQIKSPYVVQTFDQGVTSAGVPYIVMELLEGESLLDYLERKDQLCFEEAEVVIAQVGKALAGAHSRGIVHRDIKPENIFLTRVAGDIHVKVFDFGIAKHTNIPKLEGITAAGQVIGTPEFMSPEQLFNADRIDHRADLWALGVVAYCCLTGRLPFEAETLPQLCRHLIHCRFRPPSELRPELPPAVDDWFRQALHEDVEARFRTAKEMAIAFVRVMAAARISEEANALEDLFITADGDLPTLPKPSGTVDESERLLTAVKPRPRSPVWLAVPVLVAAAALAFVFRADLRSLAGGEIDPPSAATGIVTTMTSPSVMVAPVPSRVAGPAVVPSRPPPPSAPANAPSVIDGKDADAWQRILSGAVVRDNAELAAKAFIALATIAPERFDDQKNAKAAAKAAALATKAGPVEADGVFSIIEDAAFGHHGGDVLYQITSHHRGTTAATRARELLQREDVLRRATPAMRIALELRDASCQARPALFERAAKHGDARSLYVLVAMRGDDCKRISCCMKGDANLIAAVNAIRARQAAE